ncbi:Uncharacterised protein [BD1-7 clade bacterium]|uniref:Uncharacterized protein n=1 Tax=BD1-7 clade bacterium TaxID=2029982 RepID=A0A5S9Q7B5_9GAMM|nr:Uncharacterised protein [BD1-7 clade bacterium]CAA0113910.1 Uncharacterised protein [BD1-7 clade bacterium]
MLKVLKKAITQQVKESGLNSSNNPLLKKVMDSVGLSALGNPNPFPNTETDKIFSYALELGWTTLEAHSETYLVSDFALGDERYQRVHFFVRSISNDETIIQITSPAAPLSAVAAEDMQKFTNELLNKNSLSTNLGWAIEDIGDTPHITATKELLFNTMDSAEFEHATYAIAFAADEMEARFGADNF